MALALIDADSIYFRIACVTKKQKDIRSGINHTMKEIEKEVMMATFEDVTMMVAVKGRGNFRKDLYPEYKAQRKELEEDMKAALNYGHQYMVDKWGAVQADGMEADDLVSIWAYEARAAEQQYVICGIDKDLLQIPGNHYNFGKKTNDFIDDDTANLNLMLQCLTGDSTDNIPGIKGIGPKKAATILNGVPMARRWDRVRAAWRAKSAGNVNVSYDLLRMLTSWEDFDGIKAKITGETPVSKQDVLPEQEQDDGVSDLSERDEGRDDGDELAFWRQHGGL